MPHRTQPRLHRIDGAVPFACRASIALLGILSLAFLVSEGRAEPPAGGRQSFPAFVWKSEPPADCPFEPSRELRGIEFLGVHGDYRFADTWYPTWAADGNLYSPWTDGDVHGEASSSDGVIEEKINDTRWLKPVRGKATTGQAVLIGDDPLNLTVKSLGKVAADPFPYAGRYPCGSLAYRDCWFYGTYCLAPSGMMKYGDTVYNWPWLGPFVGFRVSTDHGKTWTETPHTPEKPLFGETGMWGHPVKIGSPHFVDFGKDMEHSPDGKAYLLAQGAELTDPRPRIANLSWITADQVYLLRVEPKVDHINDAAKYEFFAGLDPSGKPTWTRDFKQIKPLIEWNNNMGCVTATYVAPLKKYLIFVTDGGNTCPDEHLCSGVEPPHRPLAAGDLHEELRRAGLLREPAVEVHRRGWPDGVALLLRQLRPELERRDDQAEPSRHAVRPEPARDPAARAGEALSSCRPGR